MDRFRLARLLTPVLVILLALVVACGDGGDGQGGGQGDGDETDFGVTSELVVEAEFPVTIAFSPDGRLFYNELLSGNIRIISPDGKLLPEPFAHVDVAEGIEWGLIGLAIDPEFESNHYVYIYFMEPIEGGVKPTVMRFTDVENRGEDPTVILGDLPHHDPVRVSRHVAGNIHFGPDGYLYVSIGDMDIDVSAQDLSTARGSILRVNKEDGSAAPDNPFVDEPGAEPRIYAYGFRNSFDFTFHPLTGQIYAAENGDANCDELNLVIKGANYGWPQSWKPPSLGNLKVCQNPGAVEAVHYFLIPARFAPEGRGPAQRAAHLFSTVAPTGIEFVSRVAYPRLDDSLLVCEFNSGFMRRYFLEGLDQDIVIDGSIVVSDCHLDIALSPSGVVYYSNDKEIRRLVPTEE